MIACRALAEAEVASARRAEINAAEDARLTAERARIAFDLTWEDAANADPVRYPDALPADRVRRLNRR